MSWASFRPTTSSWWADVTQNEIFAQHSHAKTLIVLALALADTCWSAGTKTLAPPVNTNYFARDKTGPRAGEEGNQIGNIIW